MLDIQEESSEVLVNVEHPLVINNVSMLHPTVSPLEYTTVPFDRVSVTLPEPMRGECTLEFTFQSSITHNREGCYTTFNSEGDGMITSHFEPIYARKALPCFDEPAFKSVFRLQVTVHSDFSVVSNMPCSTKSTGADLTTYCFQDSPLMSCYLLHWTISKHPSCSVTASDGTELTLYANPLELSRPFLTVAKEALEYYSNYFQIHYPLPKLDVIALYQMSVRAMENWGAITFNQHALVTRPGEDPQLFPRNCRTVCHEVSHMWFGNLVTMEWWTDLWLNEGFARFMEHKCLEALSPQFKIWEKFLPDVWGVALMKDSSAQTHPIEVDCSDPKRINSIFDAISYAKGASVVRMLEDAIGEEEFRNGISEYLRTYQYKNTTTKMLWEVMDKHSPLDIAGMMEVWTKKEGFPYVSVSCASPAGFVLRQQRFNAPTEYVWNIPVKYVTPQGKVGLVQFNTEEITISEEVAWVKLNYQTKGLYIVQYEEQLVNLLSESVNTFSNEDRYGLLHDHWQLWQRQLVPFRLLGRLMHGCLPEHDYIVFKLLHDILKALMQRYRLEQFESFTQFVYKVAFPVWQKFGAHPSTVTDYDAVSTCLLAYWLLINVCCDHEIQEELVRREDAGDLPEALKPCAYNCVRGIPQGALIERAQDNADFAAHVLNKSENAEIIQAVLAYYERHHMSQQLLTKYLQIDMRLDASSLVLTVLNMLQEGQTEAYAFILVNFTARVVQSTHCKDSREIYTRLCALITSMDNKASLEGDLQMLKQLCEQVFYDSSEDSPTKKELLDFFEGIN